MIEATKRLLKAGPPAPWRAVVDTCLRVRGVSGLPVADASVMPTAVRGHTNAAAVLIGEKAAVMTLRGP